MIVLAQIFDIMIPDRQTLIAEIKHDKETLINIFEARNHKDIEKAAQKKASSLVLNSAPRDSSEVAPCEQNESQEASGGLDPNLLALHGEPEESKDVTRSPHVSPDRISINEKSVPDENFNEFGGVGSNASGGRQPQSPTLNVIVEKQDLIINPGRETVQEYLKNPMHSEDPSMTQIDILKSNSIEIFYNLLILLNNVNHSTIRDFLCSEHQKKHNYVFLRHLAQHMLYTSQQGIKVSICEFFKDLTSKETSEMQKNFQNIILFQVVSQFVDFLSEDD